MTEGKKLRAVFLSIQSGDPYMMADAGRRLQGELGIDVDVHATEYDAVDSDPAEFEELVRRSKAADIVYIRAMGSPTRFLHLDEFCSAVKSVNGNILVLSGSIDRCLDWRELFKGDDAWYRRFWTYATHRCPENDEGFLWCAARYLGLTDRDPPEPQEARPSGIYHRGFPTGMPPAEYLAQLPKGRVRVGVLFSGAYVDYANLTHVDALVERLEQDGMSAVPVFINQPKGQTTLREFFDPFFRPGGVPSIDVLVTLTSFSHISKFNKDPSDPDYSYFRNDLDVPILFGITVRGDYQDFEQDKIGLRSSDMKSNVISPEVDGDIIAVPVGYIPSTDRSKKALPIPDRIEHLSRLAKAWGSLRAKPVSERRVAIVMWQSSANSGNIGAAAGLDSMESIADILKRMKEEGYTVTGVPEDGAAMTKQILDGVTNDVDSYPREFILKNAAALVKDTHYAEEQFARIPQWDQDMTVKDWGQPPGDIHVDGHDIIIPGLVKGNVFVTYQPLRGRAEKMAENYHDPTLFAQHQYIAFYRWIQEDFKADLIINVGTHGSLEWLPGKNVGMSAKCEPGLVNNAVPNLYIYVIDDPGEGIQCKRRIESVLIGHMTPAMARADSYKEIDEVNVHLQEFFKNRDASDAKKQVIVEQIYESAKENNLLKDLGISDENDPGPDGFLPYVFPLHDYLVELKDALIRADLHILGRVPKEGHLDEMVYSLMRLDNGKVRSLRDAFALNEGIDIQACLEDPSGTTASGEVNAAAVDRIDAELMDFLRRCRADGYDLQKALDDVQSHHGHVSDELRTSLGYMCGRVVPNIFKMRDEIDHLFDGLNGEYVLPGPSGAPTRGNADLLPMGRNFYGIDPGSIPSQASWEIGKRMADQMIEKYRADRGEFPREIGFVIWATDTMKTGGDDVAYLLWLMGVRPVWSSTGGQVVGLEVIPVKELGRPRADVTVNITGLFRDTFPNLIELLDDAVNLIADLDESDEDNALAANLRKDIAEDMAKGLSRDEARRRNAVRMFGAPPGAYGTGVNQAVGSSQWETVDDLADIYLDWCSNGYSRGHFGEAMKEQFVRRFSNVRVTVKNMPDREIDLIDCDDVYEYLGGMNSFVRAYGRKDAVTYMGDDSDPKKTKIRSTQEELRFVIRSKALNPKFINGLKEHGYRGAAELANIVDNTMGWDATSGIGEDWMYEGLADKYLFDPDTQEWMKDVNPYAMMNILNRLQEAIERGLWDATDEYREKLKDLYLEVEERIEELTDR